MNEDQSLSLRIAGAQIAVGDDIDRNVETLYGAIDYAASQGVDILLTPEGSLSGYRPDFDEGDVAIALDAVTQRAAERHVGLALGTCFVEADGRCYNQIRFYDRDGTYLGFHSKTLRCGSLEDEPEGEIQFYDVRPLCTFEIKGITVGGLICNDLWANPGCTPMDDPHLTHRLAEQGARIIFHAVNGGRDGSTWAKDVVWPFHEANLRMRAQSSQLWIVTVDNCYPADIPCSAPSGIIDPTGNWVVQAPSQGEGLFEGEIRLG